MDDESALLKKYNSIYLGIITRYKNYIEENESLYVAELPKLVSPQDDAVLAQVGKIKGNFSSYNYDEDFYSAVKLAYDYMGREIMTVSLPIQFWQRPGETISNGAGDLFDKAVLLCSMLIALGCVSSKIVIAIRDGRRDFLVYSEFKDRLIVVDLENGISEAENRDELLNRLNVKEGEVSAYEFNDKMYIDIT